MQIGSPEALGLAKLSIAANPRCTWLNRVGNRVALLAAACGCFFIESAAVATPLAEPVASPQPEARLSQLAEAANRDVSASGNDDLTLPQVGSAHLWQTLVASGITLGLGTGWYVLDKRNVLDWDKPSLKSRLTGSSWRFDNNGFGMNFVLHPLFGSAVYAIARDSHHGVAGSFLASFLTSMGWEFIIEYNERVSINDVIVTPLAGVTIGEFAHKLGYYLQNPASPSPVRTALSWALSPQTRLSHLGCKGETYPRHAPDSLGYTSGLWHEFSMDYALHRVQAASERELLVHQLNLGGRLKSLRNYVEPGQYSHWFSNADVSRLTLSVDNSRHGMGVRLFTDSTLAGYAHQSISSRGTGHAHSVGFALGYSYENSTARGIDDRRSWVGFPGVATDLLWTSGFASSEIEMRAYPVFGGVSAPAFTRYQAEALARDPKTQFKTILQREGYVYGWGFVGELAAHQRLGKLRSDVSLRAESLWSAEGYDRDQASVTNDTQISDHQARLTLRVWYPIAGSLVAGIESSESWRESRAASVRRVTRQEALGLWIGARF